MKTSVTKAPGPVTVGISLPARSLSVGSFLKSSMAGPEGTVAMMVGQQGILTRRSSRSYSGARCWVASTRSMLRQFWPPPSWYSECLEGKLKRKTVRLAPMRRSEIARA